MTLKAVVFATLKYRDRKKNVAHLYKIMKPEPLRLRTIGKNYSMSQVPAQLLILSKCSFISFKDILTYKLQHNNNNNNNNMFICQQHK